MLFSSFFLSLSSSSLSSLLSAFLFLYFDLYLVVPPSSLSLSEESLDELELFFFEVKGVLGGGEKALVSRFSILSLSLDLDLDDLLYLLLSQSLLLDLLPLLHDLLLLLLDLLYLPLDLDLDLYP